MRFTRKECAVLKEQYEKLVDRGYHPRAALRIVCESAKRVLRQRGAGMGQETSILERAAAVEPIKRAREMISPWLWVLSIAGFGMAILNTRRVAKMFRKWKGAKRA